MRLYLSCCDGALKIRRNVIRQLDAEREFITPLCWWRRIAAWVVTSRLWLAWREWGLGTFLRFIVMTVHILRGILTCRDSIQMETGRHAMETNLRRGCIEMIGLSTRNQAAS